MSRSLDPRLRRLELRDGDRDQRQRQAEDDAAVFRTRIGAIAAAYTDKDQNPDPEARAKWSPAMRVAWAIRFAPNSIAPIIQEHFA